MNQIQQQAQNQQSLFKRAQEMASGKNESELEQIARNLCATKGINYEDAIKQFKHLMGK